MDKINFDDIKHTDENGAEFWLARELQDALGYAKWENFHKVIKQAMISCKISQHEVLDHFPDVRKLVDIGSGADRKIADYKLTRYACYLIVMNGDPRKEIIALGQTYFAVKTRQQELQELYNILTENDRRLFLRSDIKQKNLLLGQAAQRAGIETSFEYADFMNAGYRGLYGGLTAQDIAKRKNLSPDKEILDHMGSAELGANLFRITQTDEILKKNNVTDKVEAGTTHYRVGKKVRETIEELGGTLPEDLPTPEKSTRELEQAKRKELKDGKKQPL